MYLQLTYNGSYHVKLLYLSCITRAEARNHNFLDQPACSHQPACPAERNVPENSAHLNANDVKTGSAPEEPVQIPDFTATDQLGNEVSLEQIKV